MKKQSKKELQEERAGKYTGIQVDQLRKSYRNFQLKPITFEVLPGNILGLLGRNGAGKTTILQILAGCTKKSGGRIRIAGWDMDKKPLQARMELGFMLESNMFFEKKSLWENGLAFGKFYNGFSEKEWEYWLGVCKLTGSASLKTLSKGERMKFQFAFAMAHHPRVLLLDEPTGNLDPVFRSEFLDILQEVVEKEQLSVLLSSHLTSDMERIADQVLLLEEGELLYTGSSEEMQTRYCLVKGSPQEGRHIREGQRKGLYPEVLGIQVSRVGFEAMVDRSFQKEGTQLFREFPNLLWEEIKLADWMYYMTKAHNARQPEPCYGKDCREKRSGQHVEKNPGI